MGLILDARCGACGYTRAGLELGATHAQIAAHDVSGLEVFRAPCCGELQSVRVFLGAPYPATPCARCAALLPLAPDDRYRIATLKGQALAGHACPRCRARDLAFTEVGRFV